MFIKLYIQWDWRPWIVTLPPFLVIFIAFLNASPWLPTMPRVCLSMQDGLMYNKLLNTIDSKQNIAEFKISSLKPQSCSFHVNSTVYFKLTVICCYCYHLILHHTVPLAALASLHCSLALVSLSKYLTQIENNNLCHVYYFSSFQRRKVSLISPIMYSQSS